ncbi:TerB family tellurite resistance protein [Cytophagales bacterium LB-30]|uniref:TerB family tellurite resistance protein n=1 Tax=Shiella aurantiaca TaxID=3058365 RepID=A0ABT8F6N9_9BACT|nr:TerB family tellurite resistance protein [Shiella aurantiaca]MDN4165948.1 TerB family tellurite resistance protein [Shiella aurantiaca]
MSKARLSILVLLAKVDGQITADEELLIREIGQHTGMTEAEIVDTLQNPFVTHDVSDLSADEKFDYLFSIVQLMKVDGRMFKDEIRFCSKLAAKMGYDEAVLFELITKALSTPTIDKAELKKKVQAYLKA